MADANSKISVYSLAGMWFYPSDLHGSSINHSSDLKNTSDDTIPIYLNSLKFKQSHTLTDVRLAIGYTAFAICTACFYWDYKLGFESTKYYTTAAVALYTILNGALTFWIWGVEKGRVYVGTSPSGDKVRPTHLSGRVYVLIRYICADWDINCYQETYPNLLHHMHILFIYSP